MSKFQPGKALRMSFWVRRKLRSPDEVTQLEAIRELSMSTDPKDIAAIRDAASGARGNVRHAALAAMLDNPYVPKPERIELREKMFKDTDSRLRWLAVTEIAKEGDPRALQPLTDGLNYMFSHEGYSRQDQMEVVGLIGRIKTPEAAEVLLDITRKVDWLQDLAWEKLASLGPAGLQALTIELTKETNRQRRCRLVEVLGKTKQPEAKEAVMEAFWDMAADHSLRDIAVETLAALGWKPTNLEERVWLSLTEGDRKARRCLAAKLPPIPRAGPVPLGKGREEADLAITSTASAVNREGSGANPTLVKALATRSPFLCAIAAQALCRVKKNGPAVVGDEGFITPLTDVVKVFAADANNKASRHALDLIREALCILEDAQESEAVIHLFLPGGPFGSYLHEDFISRVPDPRFFKPAMESLRNCSNRSIPINDPGRSMLRHVVLSVDTSPGRILKHILQSRARNCGTEDLVQLAAFSRICTKEYEYEHEHYGGTESVKFTYDCSDLVDLARRELARRDRS